MGLLPTVEVIISKCLGTTYNGNELAGAYGVSNCTDHSELT
jgi:hypothetical protein